MGFGSQSRAVGFAQTLLASAAQSATSTGEAAVRIIDPPNGIVFELDVTAAATDADDTLNVFIQTSIDNTNWVDVVHFTEVLGNGGAKRYYAKITSAVNTAEFENGAALGAAAVRNIVGDQWRVRFAIVDPTGANVSFTFSVTAMPM